MKDANQIAQEASRREGTSSWRDGLQPPQRLPGVRQATPTVGTLTVWSSLIAPDVPGREPLDTFRNVTVDMTHPTVIVVRPQDTGSTYLLYPEPGWYAEFVPDADEGE